MNRNYNKLIIDGCSRGDANSAHLPRIFLYMFMCMCGYIYKTS